MDYYHFKDDYSEGCHPNILQALHDSNHSQQTGYGSDDYSLEAKALIKQKLDALNAHVHFIAGGTLANIVVLSALLKPYEAVIAAHTGHINVHETGAIEATGHKIETVHAPDGKLSPESITPLMVHLNDINKVQPKVVYISNATEMGTVYTKRELVELSDFCKTNGLYLFLDGARLPSALMAEGVGPTIADIAKLTDVFYIGGTKNGALLGEAIVITRPDLQQGFQYHLKQRGALMAKGRLLGIQFRELFRDDLIFQLAGKANATANRLYIGIRKLGYTFLTETQSNQLFPVIPMNIIDSLAEKYGFYIWQKVDEHHAAIRLVTSWATPDEVCDQFIADLRALTMK